MQKILFVSSKNLTGNLLDGAEIRMYQIMKSLSEKNDLDFVCVDSNSSKKNGDIKFLRNKIVFRISFFSRVINALICLIKLNPIQNGLFYSKEMSIFIDKNKNNYDVIIFHLSRCALYLPEDFRGIKILEASDLASLRYSQIVNHFSFFNPVKYLFWLEKILQKAYEKKIFDLFDKVVFVSKNELFETKNFLKKNKIIDIANSVEVQKKVFSHNLKNNKIIFVGNINYLPNRIACYNFIKEVLPKINIKYPKVVFHIVGKISIIDKFMLRNSNVIVHGPIKNLNNVFKNTICGICNIEIATGLQNKIFTYMSYGLPTIVSKKTYPSSMIKKNNQILVYHNNKELIKLIFELIKNKSLSNKLSKNSHDCIKKKFSLKKMYRKYIDLIK